jgi:ferritin-like metal-binding protein YciE
MHYNSLHDVFADQLADLWSAELQLVSALPKFAGAASSDTLRTAVEDHLAETRGHVARLERIIRSLALQYPNEECAAMQGLLREGERVMSASGDPIARDVALIAATQRIEHYEIAAYGTVCALADELGLGQVSDVLRETLNEESDADRTLTKIAAGGFMRQGLNEQADH